MYVESCGINFARPRQSQTPQRWMCQMSHELNQIFLNAIIEVLEAMLSVGRKWTSQMHHELYHLNRIRTPRATESELRYVKYMPISKKSRVIFIGFFCAKSNSLQLSASHVPELAFHSARYGKRAQVRDRV